MPGSTPSGGLVKEIVPTWVLAGQWFSSPCGPKAASSQVPSEGAPDGFSARPVGKLSSDERTCRGAVAEVLGYVHDHAEAGCRCRDGGRPA